MKTQRALKKAGFVVAAVVIFMSFKPMLEDIGSRFLNFTDLRYHEHLKQKWLNKSADFLIKTLGHPSCIYRDVARVILAERRDLSQEERIISLVKSKNHRISGAALNILFFWDEPKAIDLSMEIIRKGNPSTDNRRSTIYDDAIGYLAFKRYEPAFPYVVKLAESKHKFTNGSISLLEKFKKPESIVVLQKMLSDPAITAFERSLVVDAIDSLKKQAL